MSENHTEFSVNPTERKVHVMTAVAEASQHLQAIAKLGMSPGESVKSAINRAAKIVNDVGVGRKIIRDRIRTSRVEDMWRQHARRIDAEEMDAIRAARAMLEAAKHEKIENDARSEFAELNARIAALEAALRFQTTNEGCAIVDEALEEGRPLDRPLDRGDDR